MAPSDLLTNYTYAQTLIGTLIIGVCAGLIGPLVYLRHQSLVADAISHSSLPGLVTAFAIAATLGFDGRNPWVLVVGAVITGFLAVSALHTLARIAPIPQDAAIATVIATFFSLGMLAMQYVARQPLPGKAGIQDFLLGNAAHLTRADVTTSLVIGGLGCAVLLAVHHRQVAAIFDDTFARAAGIHTTRYAIAGFVVLSIVTVIGVKVVGVVLMIAVVITPAAAARQHVTRVIPFVTVSALIGGVSAVVGSVLSIAYSVPTGPAIVLVQTVIVAAALVTSPRRAHARRPR